MQATPSVQASLRFPPDLHEWLTATAAKQPGMSLNKLVMSICAAARDTEVLSREAAEARGRWGQDAH